MSVQFIGGKPGGGKSMLATKLVLDELRRSKRVIVTNLSLKLNEIAAYFAENGWSYNSDWLKERIVILTEDQLAEFYRYRKAGYVLPIENDKCDYTCLHHEDCGVFFVLDEVHIPFNSRRWQDTGPRVIYYLSQHRKLGDDVVLISQSIQNVDKQMRSMAQDFTYVRNLGKETHGLFRMPSVFIKRVFLELPTGPAVKAIETGTFRLDVTGVGRCYDTAAGVGIVGRSGADTSQKQRGFHWIWYVIGVLLLIFGTVRFVPGAVANFMSRPMRKFDKPIAGSALNGSANLGPGLLSEAKNIVPSSLPMLISSNYVTGVAKVGGYYMICISDGRVHKVTSVIMPLPGFVKLEGVLYEARGSL